jgi:hypothetical protein
MRARQKLLKEILEAKKAHDDALYLAANVTGDYADVDETEQKLQELVNRYQRENHRPVPIPSRRVEWHGDAKLPPYPQPANLRKEMMNNE